VQHFVVNRLNKWRKEKYPMRPESLARLKAALRYVATLVLLILCLIQLIGRITDLVRINHAGALALTVFVVIYILPMLIGLALYRSLNRAFEEGQIATKWRYICVDWLILLLLTTYISVSHFWR